MLKITNKAFTLIEMVIALAILIVILMLIGPLFVTGIGYFRDSNERVVNQANTRRIMSDLTREIRDAESDNVIINSSTEIQVGDVTYKYNSEQEEIIKKSGTESTVIAKYITSFDVQMDGNIITFEVKASWDDSTIITKAVTRQRVTPTPKKV